MATIRLRPCSATRISPLPNTTMPSGTLSPPAIRCTVPSIPSAETVPALISPKSSRPSLSKARSSGAGRLLSSACGPAGAGAPAGHGLRAAGVRVGDGDGEISPCWQPLRSEEHTSELQSPYELVCRLPLEKKKRRTVVLTICSVHSLESMELLV